MRIFLTGGTGYVGAAVLDAFVRAGHHVEALVRNTEKAARVQARGAQPLLGDLARPATFADAAASADGVIHAAFEYSARGPELDQAALDALLAPTTRPDRFVIYTSGIWVLGSGTNLDENAALNPVQMVAWRPQHEQRVLDAATAGIRTVVVRPGIVYGGSRGIVADLFKDAANGLVRVIGTGDNRWPVVYDRDLGELYLRLALNTEAAGVFHANDEGDETVNDIVTAIAKQVSINPSIRHVPLAEAQKKIGLLADALALDQTVRSARARAIGWTPALHSVGRNTARLLDEWKRGKEAA